MNKLKNLLRGVVCIVQFSLWKRLSPPEDEKTIYIKLKRQDIHRYVEGLIRLLERDGNAVHLVLPMNFALLAFLHEGRNWRPYNTQLLTRPNVFFSWHLSGDEWKTVSIDYFNPVPPPSYFRIPIGPHPLFFEWSHPPQIEKSGHAFFAGNMSEAYAEFDEEFWGMPSRLNSIQYLQEYGGEKYVSDRIDTQHYLEGLNSHTFFICLSGLHMPLCHSLYEALYFQCIPLVHQKLLHFIDSELANLLAPYAWENNADLLDKLGEFEDHDPDQIKITQVRMREYWSTLLNPKHLYNSIHNADCILLCAEEKSVKLATQ